MGIIILMAALDTSIDWNDAIPVAKLGKTNFYGFEGYTFLGFTIFLGTGL